MRPRRTVNSNHVFSLKGGTEDNDLWVERGQIDMPDDPCHGHPCITSVWVPTDEERQAIAEGGNVSLNIVGRAQPPVSLAVTFEALRGVSRE